MTLQLATVAISTAATPSVTSYADPGTATFTSTLHNIGDCIVIPMFGGFTQTTVVNSFATSGTGAVKSSNGSNSLQKAIGFWNTEATFDMELWWGVVTATGSTTFTATYSASLNGNDYLPIELTTAHPTATLWQCYATNTINQGTATSTGTCPSIAPPAAGAFYVGYVGASGVTTSAGSTSGYSYVNDGGDGEFMYNPACTGSAQAPTCPMGGGVTYGAISALFTAYQSVDNYCISQAVKRASFR